ncbi:class I SAM-dependent methyltransferase [Mycolicibacterium sp. XJ870]
MSIDLRSLPPAQESLFLTMAGRALDSRLPEPFLGDTLADEVITDLGYDIARFPILSTDLRNPRNKVFEIAVRAKRLDEIVRNFTDRHQNAVVLDLGAGLDGRMHRIGPPQGVSWYDVDLPEVAALRRDAVPPRIGAQIISADLRTETAWIEQLPSRPSVIVADGLIPFLSATMLTSLLRKLASHLPHGEFAFNGYTPLAVFALKKLRLAGSIDTDALLNSGFFDPRAPERWGVGLRLVEEIAIARAPEVDRLPPFNRAIHRLAGRGRGLARFVATTVLRYRFGDVD